MLPALGTLASSHRVGLAEVWGQDRDEDVDGVIHSPSGDALGDGNTADVHLLPNALTMAGLQHIIDNLCHDVHESMSHWGVYFEELKCFEAFLRVEELGPITLGVEYKPESNQG